MNKTREAVQRVLTDFFFNKDNVEKDWADAIIQTMIENGWVQKSDHVTDINKMVIPEVNISMLRQWLNEDKITDKKMVTNEELKRWLTHSFT